MSDAECPLVVLGAGGHARECVWLAAHCAPDGVSPVVAFGVTESGNPDEVDGLPVLFLEEVARRFPGARFVSGIGNADRRRHTVAQATALGLVPTRLVHPGAEISPTAIIEPGVVVFSGAVVSERVTLGAHVHVNFGCSISHDTVVGEYATLSPGVRIAGNVLVGRDVLLGIGSSVVQGQPGHPLRIGPGALVGAGACVVREVPPGAVVVGVPAKERSRDGGAGNPA